MSHPCGRYSERYFAMQPVASSLVVVELACLLLHLAHRSRESNPREEFAIRFKVSSLHPADHPRERPCVAFEALAKKYPTESLVRAIALGPIELLKRSH